MRLFVSNPLARGKGARHLALAIALATGTAMLSGMVAEPAFAQREKKERKKDEGKPQYSKEFVAVYQPLSAAVNAEGADVASLKAQFPGLLAASLNPDEKMVAGNLIYNAGVRGNDRQLQLQGMTTMLESGKVEADQVGRFNFIAYQLASALGQHAQSRAYLQTAIDQNFTLENVSAADLRIAMAESYFAENNFAQGLDYLSRAIANVQASGQKVDESWYRRGLSVGYTNKIVPQVYEVVASWVGDYPSPTNWRDAVNIARNLNSFEAPEMLDLMRLSYRVDGLLEKYEYSDYVEAADARRLPREVKRVIERAYAKGHASKDDIYLSDALTQANARISSDEADLPALERDARAASAPLRTVVAAGDTFLSYGQYDKAEEFYIKALGMPGSNTALVLTRLGIAQTELGKYGEAQATFGKVEGIRAPIARLWSTYSKQKAGAVAPAAAPAVATGS
ncbi:hypothetical protein G6N82_00865 [Altererythrobacter sp. BO-6]|uniref:hypothetical protein n=1 Tax=Altererythrobacter sp. BO-6 TaxID=2604537 RepID=UPI0013E0F2EA|nr:hypothetical protein [Altererythrobacter sp. BO-6]QIG52902.1 hypothetical protein G6N82_00865 [Altererythrobacter sp. BO-6]